MSLRRGDHAVQVWVRNAGSASDYDSWAGTSMFRVVVDPLGMPSLSSDVVFPVPSNTPVTWRASVAGGVPPWRYQFSVWRSGVGWSLLKDYNTVPTVVWTVVQPYSSSNRFAWNTMPADVGSYVIQVWVRSAGSSAAYEDWGTTGSFTLQ